MPDMEEKRMNRKKNLVDTAEGNDRALSLTSMSEPCKGNVDIYGGLAAAIPPLPPNRRCHGSNTATGAIAAASTTTTIAITFNRQTATIV